MDGPINMDAPLALYLTGASIGIELRLLHTAEEQNKDVHRLKNKKEKEMKCQQPLHL